PDRDAIEPREVTDLELRDGEVPVPEHHREPDAPRDRAGGEAREDPDGETEAPELGQPLPDDPARGEGAPGEADPETDPPAWAAREPGIDRKRREREHGADDRRVAPVLTRSPAQRERRRDRQGRARPHHPVEERPDRGVRDE